jgi:hypothetical protein
MRAPKSRILHRDEVKAIIAAIGPHYRTIAL